MLSQKQPDFAQVTGSNAYGKLRKTRHCVIFHTIEIFSTSFPQVIVDKKV